MSSQSFDTQGPDEPRSRGGSSPGGGESRFDDARREMVDRQLRRRGIADERVLAAMGIVPRERFVPERCRNLAYEDGALPIEGGQTISQPWIVACMAALLELRGDERVLEVGTGSGYAAAVLSRLCAEVVTVEYLSSLAERARSVLGELGYENVEVRTDDGARGAPDRAPFDAVTVTATVEEEPPAPLVEQLSPDGILVCPIRRESGEHLVRWRSGREEVVAPVRFVSLVG